MAVLQAEVEKMSAENERLRGMLSHLTSNYNSLQMHLVTLMQQQKAKNVNPEPDPAEKKHDNLSAGRHVVPRQFMDLGLAPAEDPNMDDRSPTLSEERSPDRSGSPVNGSEVASKSVSMDRDWNHKENVKRTSRDQVSPDPQPSTRGWSPNKVPRFSPPTNSVDQTEATIRKARVSVRARSEAAMVWYFR